MRKRPSSTAPSASTPPGAIASSRRFSRRSPTASTADTTVGNGTVDLKAIDLNHYAVVVVPSLADDDSLQPYAVLRCAASRAPPRDQRTSRRVLRGAGSGKHEPRGQGRDHTESRDLGRGRTHARDESGGHRGAPRPVGERIRSLHVGSTRSRSPTCRRTPSCNRSVT